MQDVVFRCDASPTIGAGHVSRCLALAEAFRESGRDAQFAVGPDTLHTCPYLATQGFSFRADNYESARALRDAFPEGCRVLVVDHYGLDHRFETAMRGWAEQIVVLDDATGRRHDCDVLIDSAATSSEAYAGLVSDDAELLLGPRFSLVRRAFLDARQKALQRRNMQQVKRILISFGATDTPNATSIALDALYDLTPPVTITVVLSSTAPHLAKVRTKIGSGTSLVLDADNMPELMCDSDIGIGAAGATAFERAVLGLPSVSVQTADNQASIHKMMVAAGAARDGGYIGADLPKTIRLAAETLVSGTNVRHETSMRASSLIDGLGPNRTADCIISREHRAH